MRTLALLLFANVAVLAQPAPKNCSLDGTVVNSVTGAPVPRARVALASGDDDTSVVETDAAGKWSFDHIACGEVSIGASRIGFLPMKQASRASQIRPLSADAPVHGLKLALSPQAVIAGHVFNAEGDPLPGAKITLMISRIVSGLRGLQASTSALSNDLGEYRFAGLAAGKYLLCAHAGMDDFAKATGAKPYGEECYPGPIEAGAPSALNVRGGSETTADFVLPRLAAVQIRGTVSGSPERVPVMVELDHNTGRTLSTGLSASVSPDGTFVMKNVPPGSYTLVAKTNLFPMDRPLTARATLEVGNHDLEGVQLHLDYGVDVHGTIKVLSGVQVHIDEPKYSIFLKPRDEPYTPNAEMDGNNTNFTFKDVMPGNYWIGVSATAPLYVKSATMGSRDISDTEFTIGSGSGTMEVILSDDTGAVEGDISSDDGPVAAFLYLERAGARTINVHVGPSGHFKIDSIPPGDYTIYAWDDNTNIEYANPDWMQRNGKGVTVSVEPRQTAQVKITRQTAPSE
jgi:hypothetical protein